MTSFHLSPVEIFQWGCENNIISDGGLLELAFQEARDRQIVRAERRNLRSRGISESEWPPHLREKKSSGKIYRYGRNSTPESQIAFRLKEALGKRNSRISRVGTITTFDHQRESARSERFHQGTFCCRWKALDRNRRSYRNVDR